MTDLPLPQPTPLPPPMPEARDEAFPGVIRLFIDATDIARRIFNVREVIPVPAPGKMILLFPKWLPGYHSPRSPIELLAGLVVTAGDVVLDWRRDPVEVYAFHLDVPEGVTEIEVPFQFLSPTTSDQGDVVVTPAMLNTHWNTVILYPAGWFSRRVTVEAEILVPEGWTVACALPQAWSDGTRTRFKPATLDMLVDSPIMAGRHFEAHDLTDDGAVRLNLFADRPEQLAITDNQLAAYRALVAEADALFGPRPFTHYDMLMALSDELGGGGVEHHCCAEIIPAANLFLNWDANLPLRETAAHEYVHAWNGKFRRGADSWTPSFEHPIRNSLMWVYEGQTQYWGQILAARCGLWTLDDALGALAHTAATYENRMGGVWRPMSDTTRDPIIANRNPQPWPSWQRAEDYYSEGQLVWLDVDTLIRELSGDTKSLDDFARAFFGAPDGRTATLTYTQEDVVAALNATAQYDWAGFLAERLECRRPGTFLDGLTRGGYRLVYRETQNSFAAAQDALDGALCLRFSLGLAVSTDGTVQEVIWGRTAYDAGLTAGTQIVAVDGLTFSTDVLRQAVADKAPVELVVQRQGVTETVTVDYQGGLRYPHLEPIEGARGRLAEIYASKLF